MITIANHKVVGTHKLLILSSCGVLVNSEVKWGYWCCREGWCLGYIYILLGICMCIMCLTPRTWKVAEDMESCRGHGKLLRTWKVAEDMESCQMAKRSRDDSASFSTSALESSYCSPPPILFTGQGTKWNAKVLLRKSSVTVSLPLVSF